MQAIAFDFDGLILDTETAEFVVWKEVFTEHGVQMPDGYWSSLIGRGAEQAIERPAQLLARLAGTFEDSAQKDLERRERILKLIYKEEVRPGILGLVHQCQAANVPFGVASSSKHAWVDLHLERIGLTDQFQVVVCADDVERAKPFPDLYLELCRRLKVKPEQTIALEDSPNGLSAALAAGLFAIAVPNSVTQNLDLSHADCVINDLSEITLDDLRDLFVGDP